MAAPNDSFLVILKFKYLTAEYYGRGLDAFAAGAEAFNGGERAVVEQIRAQEQAQIAELRRALGTAAPAAPDPATFDYTAGTGAPFSGALGTEGGAPYTGAQKKEFFKLAQLYGDFGARLLIGQVSALAGTGPALELVARLHATQARHAAQLRMMRGGAGAAPIDETSTAYTLLVNPWIGSAVNPNRNFDIGATGYGGTATDPQAQAYVATQVYGGRLDAPAQQSEEQDSEANQVQRGGGPYTWEAFDEPIKAEAAAAFLARFGVSVS
jgi:hypothetical protein